MIGHGFKSMHKPVFIAGTHVIQSFLNVDGVWKI
jgi:hypothetical protein